MNAIINRVISNKQGKVGGKGNDVFLPSMYMKYGFVFQDNEEFKAYENLRDTFARITLTAMRNDKNKKQWAEALYEIDYGNSAQP